MSLNFIRGGANVIRGEATMSFSTVVQVVGVIAFLTGCTLVLVNFLCPTSDIEERAWTGRVAIGTGLALLSTLLVPLGLGLLVLYAYHAEAVRNILGIIVFPVAFLGIVLTAGVAAGWVIPLVWPTMTEEAQMVLASKELAGPLPWRLTLFFALIAMAWAVLGVTTFRDLVHPPTATVLLIIGGLLILTPLFVSLHIIYYIFSGYVAALGLVLALFLKRKVTTQQT
jgi:hypothetical protein